MGAPRAQSFAFAPGGRSPQGLEKGDPNLEPLPRATSFTVSSRLRHMMLASAPFAKSKAPAEPMPLEPASAIEASAEAEADIQPPPSSSAGFSMGPPPAQRPVGIRESSLDADFQIPDDPPWEDFSPPKSSSTTAGVEPMQPSSPTSFGPRAPPSSSSRQGMEESRFRHPPSSDSWDKVPPDPMSPRTDSRGSSWAPQEPVIVRRVSTKESVKRCTSANPFWVQSDVFTREQAHVGCQPMGAPLRCLSDVVDVVDRDYELEVSEADLTTVHIQSWEQRLDWRSFLSEAVASSLARQAFKNFDVEAEPPRYARPPPSGPAPVHGGVARGKAHAPLSELRPTEGAS
ncbi:unnamed protein product [Polarella glacialis]|uniref:Uncharacterized protein n=1 Tax=Polarella glacialis TaxID=89957 RepID=A0A813K4F3_POLGL|nr:unnamed protein product [Polarella glacialis]